MDEFPRKAIKVIVPFGPGGASDSLARVVQESIRRDDLSPHPLVIINVPGAGGTIGSRRAKNARPDGYTILNLHDAIMTAKQVRHVYGPEAFVPIASTGASHTVVCTGPEGRWTSVAQALDEAAETPGEVKYGMNLGAPSHFIGLQLEQKHGSARFGMVPLQGGADRFEKLAGGHVDLSIFSVSEYLQFRKTETRRGLKALAYLGPERHPKLAGTPTAREEGIDLVTGTTQFWWAPKGTPPDRIEKIADLLERAMNSDWLRKKYAEKSVDPVFLRGEALLAEIETKRAQIVGLKVDDAEQNKGGLPVFGAILTGVGIFAGLSVFLGLSQKIAPSAVKTRRNWRPAAIVGLLSAYLGLLSLHWLPFWLATGLFAAAAGWILAPNLRTRGIVAGAGVFLAIGLQFLFQNVLIIDLP